MAAVVDLSPPSTARADLYAANLSDGEMVPTLVADDYTWDTADPDSLTGNTAIFGIGDFAVTGVGDVAESSREWFQGAIDDVAIYDGLLTPQELQVNLANRV